MNTASNGSVDRSQLVFCLIQHVHKSYTIDYMNSQSELISEVRITALISLLTLVALATVHAFFPPTMSLPSDRSQMLRLMSEELASVQARIATLMASTSAEIKLENERRPVIHTPIIDTTAATPIGEVRPRVVDIEYWRNEDGAKPHRCMVTGKGDAPHRVDADDVDERLIKAYEMRRDAHDLEDRVAQLRRFAFELECSYDADSQNYGRCDESAM